MCANCGRSELSDAPFLFHEGVAIAGDLARPELSVFVVSSEAWGYVRESSPVRTVPRLGLFRRSAICSGIVPDQKCAIPFRARFLLARERSDQLGQLRTERQQDADDRDDQDHLPAGPFQKPVKAVAVVDLCAGFR